jgi:hypothetical protein
MHQPRPELLLQGDAGATVGQREASLDQRAASPPAGNVARNDAVGPVDAAAWRLVRLKLALVLKTRLVHASKMFVVNEAEAAAIRAIFHEKGEFSAAVELRRLFPGIRNIEQARDCARAIAGWRPLPQRLRPVRLPPRKTSRHHGQNAAGDRRLGAR